MILRWDFFVQGWMQAHQKPWLVAVMRAVSLPTSGEAVAIWTAILGVGFLCRRQYRLLMAFWGGIYPGLCLSPLLKSFFERVRPLIGGKSLLSSYAFPSGHALSITVFCGILAWLGSRSNPNHRFTYHVSSMVVILCTAASRVYLGFHWTTDVLAGILMATLWVMAWTRWAEKHVLS